MAYALLRAQQGKKHPNAKPLKGFSGASVVEMVGDLIETRTARFTPSDLKTP